MPHTLTRCITLIINLHFRHGIYLEPDIIDMIDMIDNLICLFAYSWLQTLYID